MAEALHPTAIVETTEIGRCVIREYASVEAGATLADDVDVGPGARIGSGAVVHRGATIGANAVVEPGLVVGRSAVVRTGAVVRGDVPAYAVVSGNPARIVDYRDELPATPVEEAVRPDRAPAPIDVAGVALLSFSHARDLRGSLAAAEFDDLPFRPRRAFVVFDVPDESVRGAHAHRTCGQVLCCVHGAVTCVVDDGVKHRALELGRPDVGLFVPPLVWSMQYRYSADAVLLVYAELPYDPDDYIRDYEEFLALVGRG